MPRLRGRGGRPLPSVRWWREEKLVDSTDTVSAYPNVKHNVLVVKRLERKDLHARFTCQASNNNISQPVSATVTIEMYSVELNTTSALANYATEAGHKCIEPGYASS
uniref:Ig-like domain-containing protein n=1 Tax=Timema douglasi TaxID=61478 RepID=A0A7R8VBZ9_TIMDO|nr:unnamed protein product [Timema douglasi]